MKAPNVIKKCVILETGIEECIRRDSGRERSVGASVIIKISQQYQQPLREEGFDEIIMEKDTFNV